MSLNRPARHLALLLTALALTSVGRSAVAVASSYTENFDSLGSALPEGWGLWTSSTATGNGTAFAWSTADVANNAAASVTSYFRNLPGASQDWSAALSSGADRALGWRAGNQPSTDGSITFTWSNTTSWTFSDLSFDLFTPNNSGTTAIFNLEYQIGATGTFSQLAEKSYTTVLTPTAPDALMVNSLSLTALQLSVLNDQSGQVTLRINNIATTGTNWESLSLDNFHYNATTATIPEPASCTLMLGAGVLLLALDRRVRRKVGKKSA
jgi:hypothetical protein